ncbi:hypothetical protein JOE61_000355 [Nocardioides salarius]|uniref:Uncharacterized protein n=1 Tax=Nocardioides salarius TaxID=374513 RepID=A0ABS2M5R4_9ACTN|nr:hypothetical protein [Nocardioides salarius]MBM7506541.1 hypothetical protein [Nocardioides salarius]
MTTITTDDERRAMRLVLGMVTSDDTACRVVLGEAIDVERHTHLLIATARYAATLTAQAVPNAQDQLRGALLSLAAENGSTG